MKRYASIVLNLAKFWKRVWGQSRAGKVVHTFVRRGLVSPKNAKQLSFYMTHPRNDIQGYADFIERKTGDAKYLWKTLEHESLPSSYDEYQGFLQGRKKATFIRFRNLRELSKPVTIQAMAQIIGKERMPQKGMYITRKKAHKQTGGGGAEIEGN